MTAKGNGKAMVPTEKAVAVRSYPTMSNESDVTTEVESMIEELAEDVDDMETLPSPSEADLGELCRVEGSVQFRNNDLLEGSEGLEVFEG